MNCRTVAWVSDQEWAQVYKEAFYETDKEKHHALDVLKVWRLRFGNKTPIAIEATSTLLEALLLEKNTDCQQQQFLSAAVMQFVGLMTEQRMDNVSQVGIRTAGEQLGLPEWIIDVRHHIAHHAFPSVKVLRKAVVFCLDWLRVNHWDKQAEMNSSCNLPLMTLIANGTDKHHDIDGDLSVVLSHLKVALSMQNQSNIAIEIENVKELCNSHYEVQRLCVLFVLSGSYQFLQSTLYKFIDFQDDAVVLPNEVSDMWKSIIMFIAEHKQLPTLLYCLVLELCNTGNILSKIMLAMWSIHILNLLNSITIKQTLSDNPIFVECLKLLISHADIYTNKVYKHISTVLSEIFNEEKLEKIHQLKQIFLPTSKHASKIPSNDEITFTVDDVVTKLNSLETNKCRPKNTWSLYDGESFNQISIGCLPNQFLNSLSQQLYKFSEWRMHTNVYDLHNCLDKNGRDELVFGSDEETCISKTSEEIEDLEIDTAVSTVNEPQCEANSGNFNQKIECFKNITPEDWDSMALSLDIF